VSRMEPENHPLEVRQAFERVRTDMRLALVGDAPYARDYIQQVRDTKDPRVVMPGAIYGQGYHELGSHCFAYIHATEVGGTHPALIEAMGRGALALYRNTPENADLSLVIWNRSWPHYRRALGASKGERLCRMQLGEAGRSRRWC